MQTIKKAIYLFVIILFSNKSVLAQQLRTVPETTKQIVFQINSYTVETDKLIQKEFSNIGTIKIIFTCISGGLLVFESKSDLTTQDYELIQQKIKKAAHNNQFIQLTDFHLKEAEEKCSSFRSN